NVNLPFSLTTSLSVATAGEAAVVTVSGSGDGTGSASTVSGNCLRPCGGVAAAGVWAHMPVVNATNKSPSPHTLLRRCIVALAIVHRQRRKTWRRRQSHLQFTPCTVPFRIGGRV